MFQTSANKMVVTIEYCSVWRYTDRAVSLAADITKQFEANLESVSLIPSDGGRFEVTVNGELVFSKKGLGRHAEPGEVVGIIAGQVNGGAWAVRALVQRVRRGKVTSSGATLAEIGPGMVILLGVGERDGEQEADWLASKCAHLRIYPDEAGKMNRSLLESGGEAIVVSQFTLYGDVSKGRRPSFIHAAQPEQAQPLVERFVRQLEAEGVATQSGSFGAEMLVEIDNDGPVTLLLERWGGRQSESHQAHMVEWRRFL